MATPPVLPTSNEKSRSGDTTITQEPGQILLVELLNQLALFFKHTMGAKGARATAVIFDQIIQRLKTIEKVPGNAGGLILRRIARRKGITEDKPDYRILCGSMVFEGSEIIHRLGKKGNSNRHLTNALDSAFGCLVEHGIFSLYIEFPGDVSERVDQLRLALNIVARFHHAVENNASITFRYFGRAMTIPLIRDQQGRPDANLTLVAGLNGLTATNMRELMKQAEAFSQLSGKKAAAASNFSSYNLIFDVKSLKTQLIRPLVEVNNLPWMHDDG
jgi:hypothetical protein